MVFYASPIIVGTDSVSSLGDGYTINVKWFQAAPSVKTNKILYHIYYSTDKDNVFSDGVKYISYDGSLNANIINLTPGQLYFFAVRPVEYNPSVFNVNSLPLAYDNLKFYPTSLLRSNISATDLTIPLLDVEGFPNTGIIKIGVELIQYLSVDSINNNLILTNINQRGVENTYPTQHDVDGYDGYTTWDPTVRLFTLGEAKQFDRIYACQSRFEYPNFSYTEADGYHQVTKDLFYTDLTASDEANTDFPTYDYAGYHRTDPVLLLNGACVGSYIGGEMGCIDGYGNVNILRGLSVQDHNNQRQEILLSVTGRPAVLIHRVRTGITCNCYLPSSEYQDDRCPICLGSKFVVGYQQYFNPRRSDGRILVRPDATDETAKMNEAGLESEFPLSLWTLTVPTIKQRDIIVLFDINDNEEFRYEVTSVTRNNTTIGQQGGQKFKAVRIRKYDPAYQIRIFRNTAEFPQKYSTSIGFGPGIPPHVHEVTGNQTSPSNWSQNTTVVQGHNHTVIFKNGVLEVLPILGHTHTVII